MADILISKFTTQIPRVGATPATPGFAESEGQDPVAPSGTPQVYTPVTIGSPANGLSIDGSQVLTIGLASTSATGALSSTDWNTFNGKIGGSLTSGRIPFATGANTLSDDADLTWDNVNNIFSITGKVNINFGTSNLLIGLNAGAVISTGNSNVGIGALSLNSLTTAVSNVAIGANTLRSNVSGNNNTAVGGNALLNATLGALVAIGLNAGRFFTGNNNATGISNSVFIGNNSSAFSNTSSGEIVIGNFAVGLGNNTTVIGTTSTVATILPAGSLWVNTTSGTNTLDVNGTARIRTISNLGTAATSVLVPSATGVVSLRTLAELAADGGFGGSSKWTDATTYIYRNGPVVIGDVSSYNAGAGQIQTFVVKNNILFTAGNTIFSSFVDSSGTTLINFREGVGNSIHINPSGTERNVYIGSISSFSGLSGMAIRGNSALSGAVSFLVQNNAGTINNFSIRENGDVRILNNLTVGVDALGNNWGTLLRGFGNNVSTRFSLIVQRSTGTVDFAVASNGALSFFDGGSMIFGTVTGMKLGTATSQKLAFWNKTPIVQPTNAIGAAAFVANTSGIANDTATYGGYTMGQIAQALINVGILA